MILTVNLWDQACRLIDCTLLNRLLVRSLGPDILWPYTRYACDWRRNTWPADFVWSWLIPQVLRGEISIARHFLGYLDWVLRELAKVDVLLRIISVIRIERGTTNACMLSIVVPKLCEWKQAWPVILLIVATHTNILLDRLMHKPKLNVNIQSFKRFELKKIHVSLNTYTNQWNSTAQRIIAHSWLNASLYTSCVPRPTTTLVRYLLHLWYCRRIDTSDPRKQKVPAPQKLRCVPKNPQFDLFEQESQAWHTR
jgi:hypothetical protein